MALFGTDGVRGIANRDLSPELAFALGRATVQVSPEARPQVAIGRDTRASGELLEAALSAGVCSAGGDVLRFGVVPTPAVAFLTSALGAHAGIVVSASHNPPEYNGIKIFGPEGMKLPDADESKIEALVAEGDGERPEGRALGRITEAKEAEGRYLDHLAESAEASLGGMRVVVDCANGAAHRLAPEILRRLGAEVYALHDEPNGWNINMGCGATHPEVLVEAVRSFGADAGVAHDGDADRAIFADAEGRIVDGDHVLAACALALKEDGALPKDVVVATVMANLGFRKAMEDGGVTVQETKVGDRYVLEEMLRVGATLGGEQSGHVIFLDRATTGDGLLTAVRMLSLAKRKGVSLAELASCVTKFPQVLIGVEVADRGALPDADPVWEAVRGAEAALGSEGRVLVRASGTEPLVRVMVEAKTEEDARKHAEGIAATVRDALGA